jgi:hypothetical protein
MPSNFKSLYLDQSKIAAAVAAYDTDCQVLGPKDCGGYQEYELRADGQKPARLHVYNKNDATTTLNPNVGANQVVSHALAEHVALACRKVQFEQKPLGVNFLSEENWRFLVEYLQEEGYKVTKGAVPYGERFDVWKAHGDTVNINRYDSGRFLMQGKARNLYGIVAAALCDLVPDKKAIVQAQLQSFSIEGINAVDLLEELRQLVPNAVEILGDTGMAFIAPSLAYIKIDLNLPDYSSYAFPALKGLEAYMKSILSAHGYIIGNKDGMKKVFISEALLPSVRTKIACQATTRALEESFKLYNLHRHGLFHADGVPALSRLIETRAEAITIVHAVLHCIESTASAIPK